MRVYIYVYVDVYVYIYIYIFTHSPGDTTLQVLRGRVRFAAWGAECTC